MQTIRTTLFKSVGVAALFCTGATIPLHSTMAQTSATQVGDEFAQFVPKAKTVKTRIDYAVWDEALRFFVVTMGKSIREGAPRVDPGMGTRRVYGHDSRLRLEGNRVGFSFLEEDVVQSLVEYRADLERTAEQVDIATLSRNEQLAFWLNLHNVAIIEQIALQYPESTPSRMKVGETGLWLDESPFINVAGVAMSPRDIRTKIVYPNWKDPKVIYGFFRGDIGGPSIQRDAYTAANLDSLLDKSAKEFINSLRGTAKSGKTMKVSDIFEEARPFFFQNWPVAIRSHYENYAEDAVKEIMGKTVEVEPAIYETDIADLSNGERDPNYNYIEGNQGLRVPTAVARLMVERQQKVDKIIKRDGRVGTVTFIDIDLDGNKEPTQVE